MDEFNQTIVSAVIRTSSSKILFFNASAFSSDRYSAIFPPNNPGIGISAVWLMSVRKFNPSSLKRICLRGDPEPNTNFLFS